MIKITLNIDPHAWARVGEAIIFPKGKKPFIHHYTMKDMQEYQDTIKSIVRSRLPADWTLLDEPLVVDMIFYLVSPQKPRWPVPAVKPDDENLSKNISDAFNKLIWFDDSRVVDRRIRKLYSATGKGYIEIRIKRWTADESMNEIQFPGKQLEL